MRSALNLSAPKAPEQWQQLPLGLLICEQLEQVLDEPSRRMFGYHMLKVGGLSSQLTLPNCPIKHRVNLTGHFAQQHTQVQSLRSHLPFQESSIDALILANELDFAKDPHQILREVHRVIIPNGYLVLSGFNPYSLAGLAKYLPFKPDSLLHEARFFSYGRVKDWLQLLGFEIINKYKLVYSELLFERPLRPKTQQLCRHYARSTGAVYMLVARKRVIPLSLIKPRWVAKPRFAVVNASASRSCKDGI